MGIIAANVIVGIIVGSSIGFWLAGVLGLATYGSIAQWLVAVAGAVILIWILKAVGSSEAGTREPANSASGSGGRVPPDSSRSTPPSRTPSAPSAR